MSETILRIEADASGMVRASALMGASLSKLVAITTYQIQQAMVVAIDSGPKTGRIYERGERGVSFVARGSAATSSGYRFRQAVSFTAKRGSTAKAHQASAPGEAPARDTGALAGSIQMTMIGKYIGVDSINASYARALEFGTANGKIAPRPFVRPAVAKAAPGFHAGVKAIAGEVGR